MVWSFSFRAFGGDSLGRVLAVLFCGGGTGCFFLVLEQLPELAGSGREKLNSKVVWPTAHLCGVCKEGWTVDSTFDGLSPRLRGTKDIPGGRYDGKGLSPVCGDDRKAAAYPDFGAGGGMRMCKAELALVKMGEATGNQGLRAKALVAGEGERLPRRVSRSEG